MLPPPPPPLQVTENPTIPAPSNRATEYTVDVTTSSDLSRINHRIIITRFELGCAPFIFELLLTDEQYIVWCQMFGTSL